MKIEKTCKCGAQFFVRPYKKDTAKFCSTACKYRFFVKRSGFKRVDKVPNPNWFKRGQQPWNTNTTGRVKANTGSFQKGEHHSVATEFKQGHVPAVPSESVPRGDAHSSWKGEQVGYGALHSWVRRYRGEPQRCEHCGASDRQLHWANKSHQYKRDLDDWLQLCVPCHKAYDQCVA